MKANCEHCKKHIQGTPYNYRNYGPFCNQDHALAYMVKLNRDATDKLKKEN